MYEIYQQQALYYFVPLHQVSFNVKASNNLLEYEYPKNGHALDSNGEGITRYSAEFEQLGESFNTQIELIETALKAGYEQSRVYFNPTAIKFYNLRVSDYSISYNKTLGKTTINVEFVEEGVELSPFLGFNFGAALGTISYIVDLVKGIEIGVSNLNNAEFSTFSSESKRFADTSIEKMTPNGGASKLAQDDSLLSSFQVAEYLDNIYTAFYDQDVENKRDIMEDMLKVTASYDYESSLQSIDDDIKAVSDTIALTKISETDTTSDEIITINQYNLILKTIYSLLDFAKKYDNRELYDQYLLLLQSYGERLTLATVQKTKTFNRFVPASYATFKIYQGTTNMRDLVKLNNCYSCKMPLEVVYE